MKLKLFLFTFLLSIGNSQAQEAQDEIEQMLSHFVKSLNNLELESFMENFTDHATVFFPRNSFPVERVEGREAIKKEFETFFNGLRQRRPGPPFLDIVPKDREIDVYNQMAVVSFHFEFGGEFQRRTIILEKQNNKWLINHIHASLFKIE